MNPFYTWLVEKDALFFKGLCLHLMERIDDHLADGPVFIETALWLQPPNIRTPVVRKPRFHFRGFISTKDDLERLFEGHIFPHNELINPVQDLAVYFHYHDRDIGIEDSKPGARRGFPERLCSPQGISDFYESLEKAEANPDSAVWNDLWYDVSFPKFMRHVVRVCLASED